MTQPGGTQHRDPRWGTAPHTATGRGDARERGCSRAGLGTKRVQDELCAPGRWVGTRVRGERSQQIPASCCAALSCSCAWREQKEGGPRVSPWAPGRAGAAETRRGCGQEAAGTARAPLSPREPPRGAAAQQSLFWETEAG